MKKKEISNQDKAIDHIIEQLKKIKEAGNVSITLENGIEEAYQTGIDEMMVQRNLTIKIIYSKLEKMDEATYELFK